MMLQYYTKRVLFLCLIVSGLLCGCAPRPQLTLPGAPAVELARPAAHTMTWQGRVAQLQGLRQWVIQGAFSVRYQEKTTMASLAWRQLGSRYTLTFSGPMNIGGMRLVGRPNHVTLYQSADRAITASTPEQLMFTQLGWNLPVSDLNYWVRGIPVPGMVAQKSLDRYHHLISLSQQGWRIRYLRYASYANIDLPTKIVLMGPQTLVQLVIKRWVV